MGSSAIRRCPRTRSCPPICPTRLRSPRWASNSPPPGAVPPRPAGARWHSPDRHTPTAMTDTASQTLLELTDIWKSFPGVTALKGVSLSLRSGEIHALLGENGAGKSTLMSVAAGTISPDSGTIAVGGDTLTRLTPAVAQRHRVAIVHQHPAVVPDLTVAENLALAAVDVRPTQSWMREHLARVNLDVSLGARLEDLTVAQRQLLELTKAM